MRTELKKTYLTLLCGLIGSVSFCQVQLPKTPSPSTFQTITPNQYMPENIIPIPNVPTVTNFGQDRVRQQNQQLIAEIEQNEKIRRQQQNQMYRDIAEFNKGRINYSLPSHAGKQGAIHFQKTFNQLNQTDFNDYSVKDLTFMVENTYFEDELDKAEFDNIISNIGKFLTTKMDELGYDKNSNSAKNFMIFQFFSERLELKNGTEHLPFEYDFEDYMAMQDYSKMFVTKLLKTQKGQCHSMPLLYLIVAEEIGAEAYLAYSPNHSYIRFLADNGKWYNIELTNGMFSTSSYILQSGFIKSEALLNKIYMQNLSDKEVMAQFYTDLANAYIAKYGYDDFVGNVVSKALELYPNSISANMIKANLLTMEFEYVCKQVVINPCNQQELQNIRHYPKVVEMLNAVNAQYATIDNLGYTHMPADAYQDWLQSMKKQESLQENQRINEQFKGLLNKQPVKN